MVIENIESDNEDDDLKHYPLNHRSQDDEDDMDKLMASPVPNKNFNSIVNKNNILEEQRENQNQINLNIRNDEYLNSSPESCNYDSLSSLPFIIIIYSYQCIDSKSPHKVVEQRLSNIQQKYQQNRENLIQKLAAKELQEIQPIPSINKNTDKILSKSGNSTSPFKMHNSNRRIEDR